MGYRFLVLVFCGSMGSAAFLPTRIPAKDKFAADIAPIIAKFCAPCHAGKTPAGKAPLLDYKTEAQVRKSRALWDKVIVRLSKRQMPPSGTPQPSADQRKKVIAYLQGLHKKTKGYPGRVTMRRLNRAEYDNTIRDLVGIDVRAARDFPSDDVGNGFDNIGDVLSISPLLMEKYLDSAEGIAAKAILVPPSPSTSYDAAAMTAEGGASEREGELAFYSQGSGAVTHRFARRGTYRVRILASAQQAGPDTARMSLLLDNAPVATFEVRATKSRPAFYEADVEPSAGAHALSVAFVNDYYQPADPNPHNRDRNLYVQRIEIVAPPEDKALPPSQRRIIFVQPEPGKESEAARLVLARFARRAYRRPVAQSEVDSLMKVFDLAAREKEPFERGIQLGVQAALSSPNFIFKVERASSSVGMGSPGRLTSHEVAVRLSYFLWSSMPDEALFTLADKNALQTSDAIAAQVRRMLRDPKARALADNFASQWLQLRKLDNVNPDPARFPFSEDLREAMRQETLMFFQSVVDEDRSVLDFIDADYTFLNGLLARHYGIGGVEGDRFRRVTLDGRRAGVLTQASILTVTSNPTRTSPVKRGKWILENILNDPPPPPPPGADNLGNDPRKLEGKTLRTVMAEHRINPSCANCHARMDTLGLGLENFDAVGRWRNQYTDGLKIDAGGRLPDGRAFSTPRQLISLLAADKERFVRALTERLLTYALGRGLAASDTAVVDGILEGARKKGYRFSSIVTAIASSEPFRKQRG